MSSYLDRDDDLIRACLPDGTDVPNDTQRLFVLYAVLLRVKGEAAELSDVHDAWSAWMLQVDPDHESIKPFDELDNPTRDEDRPFLAAIRRAAQLR